MALRDKVEELEAFAGDEALKQLEEAQSRFNIFEAMGATHKELWHSDFLAFLLNPHQSHGLGDEFTKLMLRRANPALAEFDSWDGVSVRREYRFIDILIEDDQKKVSIIIENKIWSPEIPGQLSSYWGTIASEHSSDADWRTYGIFLTPDGQQPIEDKDRKCYRALSYREAKNVLSDILKTKSGRIDPDVETTICHYIDMLERFILGNADAEALARKLYFRHSSAIRLMSPVLWKGWIRSHLERLVKESGQLRPEGSNLEYVRFRVGQWDAAKGLKADTNSVTSYPVFYFTFNNFEDSLILNLWIGPSVSQDVREKLIQLGEQHIPPFCKPGKEGSYYYIYQLKFLAKNDYEICSDEDLKALIETKWLQFTDDALPRMLQALEPADWFWNVQS